MRYILTAEGYFNELSSKVESQTKLEAYFSKIPTAFFEALETVNRNSIFAFNSISSNHTDDEILEHQRFILEADDIFAAMRYDDLLSRLGHDTVELYKNSEYLDTLAKVNEGVMSTVMNFIKGIVDDPDPTEYALNILRLILDVIGIIPFTWAGFPIDVVANGLSALISWHKGEYFSAVLSGIAMIDVSHASAVIGKIFTGPAAKLLNGFFKIAGRPEAIKIEAVALRQGIIHIGGKSLLKMTVDLFKNFAKFIISIPVKILEIAMTFIKKVFGAVPLVGKFVDGVVKFIEKMRLNLSLIGKNIDSAAKILEEGAAKDLAKGTTDLAAADAASAALKGSKRSRIAKTKTGTTSVDKAAANDLIKKSGETTTYLKDLELEIRKSKEYEAILKTGDKSAAEVLVKAKTGNALTGETIKSLEQALKDAKSLKGDAAKAFVQKVDGKSIEKFVKNSSEAEVKELIESLLKNPELAKNLSLGERRCLGIFSNNPTALKSGLKYFDDTEKVLKTLYKMGGVYTQRATAMQNLILLVARLFWRKYSPECMITKAKSAISAGATSALSAAVSEDADTPTYQIPQATLDKIKADDPTSYAEIVKTLDQAKKPTETTATKRNPCSTAGVVNNAVIGSTFSSMLPDATKLAYTYSGKDMQKAADTVSKAALQKAGLPTDIDQQNALADVHPAVKAYYSDVYDFKNGQVSLNTEQNSRMDSVIADMVKSGEISQAEAEEIKKQAISNLASGTPPKEENADRGRIQSTNESLFRVKRLQHNDK